MDGVFSPPLSDLRDLAAPAWRILDVQDRDGRIAWFEDGPWDPWNHVECAMALTAMGAIEEAGLAYDYLMQTQRPDGAWLGEYGNTLPMVDRDYISRQAAPAFLDSNFCAYPAVGVLHFLLATGDVSRVRGWWPMIRDAMNFVLTLQRADGTISWAFEAVGTSEDGALLAGNASIAKSLECAVRLARRMDEDATHWVEARRALVAALQCAPTAFKSATFGERFAMDWYYPVLSGALGLREAAARIDAGWKRFVVDDLGCLCVRDEPWVTVAETCELALALLHVKQRERAEAVLDGVLPMRNASGVFWMGWQYEEQTVWPKEAPSWTQAAFILAVDALRSERAHSQLLIRSRL